MMSPIVREAYLRLSALEQVTWFTVEAENFESIHNHSAYAAVELDRRNDQLQNGAAQP